MKTVKLMAVAAAAVLISGIAAAPAIAAAPQEASASLVSSVVAAPVTKAELLTKKEVAKTMAWGSSSTVTPYKVDGSTAYAVYSGNALVTEKPAAVGVGVDSYATVSGKKFNKIVKNFKENGNYTEYYYQKGIMWQGWSVKDGVANYASIRNAGNGKIVTAIVYAESGKKGSPEFNTGISRAAMISLAQVEKL